jgi:hypothetical protein
MQQRATGAWKTAAKKPSAPPRSPAPPSLRKTVQRRTAGEWKAAAKRLTLSPDRPLRRPSTKQCSKEQPEHGRQQQRSRQPPLIAPSAAPQQNNAAENNRSMEDRSKEADAVPRSPTPPPLNKTMQQRAAGAWKTAAKKPSAPPIAPSTAPQQNSIAESSRRMAGNGKEADVVLRSPTPPPLNKTMQQRAAGAWKTAAKRLTLSPDRPLHRPSTKQCSEEQPENGRQR